MIYSGYRPGLGPKGEWLRATAGSGSALRTGCCAGCDV